MKVRVKKGYTAYYKLKLLSSGTIVDYDGINPPVWGEPILIITDEKDLAKFVVKPPKDNNKTDKAETEAKNEKAEHKTDVNDEDLTKQFNELLDEAVCLGIAFTPDENAAIEENISALKKLIQKPEKDNV